MLVESVVLLKDYKGGIRGGNIDGGLELASNKDGVLDFQEWASNVDGGLERLLGEIEELTKG